MVGDGIICRVGALVHTGLRTCLVLLTSNGWVVVTSICMFVCLIHYRILHWVLVAYNGAITFTLFSIDWYSVWGFIFYIRVSDADGRDDFFTVFQSFFFITILLCLHSYKFLFFSIELIYPQMEDNPLRSWDAETVYTCTRLDLLFFIYRDSDEELLIWWFHIFMK